MDRSVPNVGYREECIPRQLPLNAKIPLLGVRSSCGRAMEYVQIAAGIGHCRAERRRRGVRNRIAVPRAIAWHTRSRRVRTESTDKQLAVVVCNLCGSEFVGPVFQGQYRVAAQDDCLVIQFVGKADPRAEMLPLRIRTGEACTKRTGAQLRGGTQQWLPVRRI